ncbi:MAG: hypothetical protein HZA93_27530 [Verrucomicrobia bacterium]|nr:hypothetical protein [Verrucomicrobiota bacterium]
MLKFVLTGGGSWLSPYITITAPAGIFGTPTLGTNNQVTVSDTNADTNKYSYTISYNPPSGASPRALVIDPDIQNSNEN